VVQVEEREREVFRERMSSGCNTSLSLSLLLDHPPTVIGRFLAYPSDENFPEKFK
jgi:hypothetical protein